MVEVLGPATYVFEVEGGILWKRHVDQLKKWLGPVVGATQETPPEMPIDAGAGFDSDDVTVNTPPHVDEAVPR